MEWTPQQKMHRITVFCCAHVPMCPYCLTAATMHYSLRLLKQSQRPFMKYRYRHAPFLIFAAVLFAGVSGTAAAQKASTQVYLPQTPQTQQIGGVAVPKGDPDKLLNQVMAEANARIQSGQPADDVEAWMGQQLEQAGMNIEAPPPAWDVFGSARWELENPGAESGENAARGIDEIATIGGFHSRNPVDGRYEQTEKEEDPQFSDEAGSRETDATGESSRSRQVSTHLPAGAGSAGGFFVYANAGGRSQEPTSHDSAPVRLRPAEAGRERPAARGAADNAPGFDRHLRGGSSNPAAAPGSAPAGADTD